MRVREEGYPKGRGTPGPRRKRKRTGPPGTVGDIHGFIVQKNKSKDGDRGPQDSDGRDLRLSLVPEGVKFNHQKKKRIQSFEPYF